MEFQPFSLIDVDSKAPLKLEALDLLVQIADEFVRVSLTTTFKNDRAQDLEGEMYVSDD